MDTNKVYVLYTGGTIGMDGHPLAPMAAKQFKKTLASMPGCTETTITIQTIKNKDKTIDYTIDAFPTPIDSSSMTPTDWIKIAQRILENYTHYTGFVVLHGTDTMAWTSSALSYLLNGLTKPVIVTGAQIPLAQTRNDGFRNLVTSIQLAATTKIPEVCLFFDAMLLRGNRATKVNSNHFAGFASPNYPPLAVAGIDIVKYKNNILQPPKDDAKSLDNNAYRKALRKQLNQLSQNMKTFSVVSLILYPGIQASTVKAIFNSTQPKVKAMVLQAFGEGDAPSVKSFLAVLAQANKEGVTIVDNTQCLMGTVNIEAYESATGLIDAGVVSGYDLTPEATLCKLIYLHAKGLPQSQIKKKVNTEQNGDLTTPNSYEMS